VTRQCPEDGAVTGPNAAAPRASVVALAIALYAVAPFGRNSSTSSRAVNGSQPFLKRSSTVVAVSTPVTGFTVRLSFDIRVFASTRKFV
jgi:hypothetical protein